jgi:hypothetical protein
MRLRRLEEKAGCLLAGDVQLFVTITKEVLELALKVLAAIANDMQPGRGPLCACLALLRGLCLKPPLLPRICAMK